MKKILPHLSRKEMKTVESVVEKVLFNSSDTTSNSACIAYQDHIWPLTTMCQASALFIVGRRE